MRVRMLVTSTSSNCHGLRPPVGKYLFHQVEERQQERWYSEFSLTIS